MPNYVPLAADGKYHLTLTDFRQYPTEPGEHTGGAGQMTPCVRLENYDPDNREWQFFAWGLEYWLQYRFVSPAWPEGVLTIPEGLSCSTDPGFPVSHWAFNQPDPSWAGWWRSDPGNLIVFDNYAALFPGAAEGLGASYYTEWNQIGTVSNHYQGYDFPVPYGNNNHYYAYAYSSASIPVNISVRMVWNMPIANLMTRMAIVRKVGSILPCLLPLGLLGLLCVGSVSNVPPARRRRKA